MLGSYQSRLPESPLGVHVLNPKPASDGKVAVEGGEESVGFSVLHVYLDDPQNLLL